jgi:predicted O-methyltransferase YrrM
LLAWATGTELIGFGITLFGLLGASLGVLLLRQMRRIGASVNRLSTVVGRDSREIERQGIVLKALLVSNRDTNRAISAPMTPDGLDSRLAMQLHQHQAMLNLFHSYEVSGILPTMGGRAASADTIALLISETLRIRPRLIVECGSGPSTVWLALAIRDHGLECRIVSLEHDESFASDTRRDLQAQNLHHIAEVRHAPLRDPELVGHATTWYDRSALTGLSDIGLLFVDGPPDSIGPMARFPAVPLLGRSLAATATVVLDDVIRPAEAETADRWRIQLHDFVYEHLPLKNGAATFRRA